MKKAKTQFTPLDEILSLSKEDSLSEFSKLAEAVSSSAKKILDTETKKMAVTRVRCRKRFSFWLEIDKVGQGDLIEWFNELKTMRQFAPVIRFAVSLYRELLAGETTMLYHFFPDLKPAPPPPPTPPKDYEEMKQRITILESEVDLLRGILIKQQSPGAVDMTVKMSGVGAPKPLQKIAPPPVDTGGIPGASDDSDVLVVRKDETAGERATQNFIKSMLALNSTPSKSPVEVEVDTSSAFLNAF